ncbi:MAG: putative glutamate--cysteine ligase 2 [Jatrophihabitans sp.]|nr:putative glutamate--cysteine ligase 2 [Jatrophihabitans sp.]
MEEEFLLVRADGELADEGDAVVRDAAAADESGQFEHELKRAQVEIGSAPASDLRSLTADLTRLRRELAVAAADDGARLVASGTHPTARHPRTTADERYRRMTETFGMVARQQLTCGMHVHVSVESPEEGVAVIDRVQPWLPLLTALSSNSPLRHGEDTGYASYRSVLWGQWPTAGPTPLFGDVAAYRRLQQGLIASGAAMDDGMLYFDARLSAHYPTVEIRVADVCPAARIATAIAGLARALVETAAREWRSGEAPSGERVELLRARAWRAARWGMAGELIAGPSARLEPRPAWHCVDELLEHVRDALDDLGDAATVTAGLAELRAEGTGAQRQRDAYAAGGFGAVLDLLTLAAADPDDQARNPV